MIPVVLQGGQLVSPVLTNKINAFFEGIDSDLEIKYKHLHSAVEKLKGNKAKRRDFLYSQFAKLNQSGTSSLRANSSNKFLKLSLGTGTLNVSVEETLHSFDENYLTQVMMSESLKSQFVQYQNSLASLKHTIQDLNREIQQINNKKPTYDKVNTIYRFQSISSAYVVGKAQKDHLRLVKQRQSLENAQLELDKKHKEARVLDISMRNQMEQKINSLRLRRVVTQQELSRINTLKRNSNQVSNSMSIVTCYQRLMELFTQKESTINDLKLQNCTKEGRPLRIYSSMPQQKVRQISKINQFEQQHSTRLSSICNLVKAIFIKLKTNEEDLNLQYQQLLLVRDDKQETAEQLKLALGLTRDEGQVTGLRQLSPRQQTFKEDPEIQTKKQQTKTRSKFWIELVQFWNTLILKMTNVCRAAELYEVQGLPNINTEVSYFLNKHTSIQNQIHLKSNQNFFLSLMYQHFQGVLSHHTIAHAFEIVSMDWRSLYYLRTQSVQQTVRLPQDGSPHLILYSVIDELLTESGNSFRSYVKQSFNIYLSCYNFLANHKHSFLLRKALKRKKNEQPIAVRVDTEQSHCQLEVKEQSLMIPTSQIQNQDPKPKQIKKLDYLMRMAAIPLGQLHSSKSSKQGCFF